MTPDQVKRLKEALKKYINMYMQETSVTGAGGGFNPGQGEQYASPMAFKKKKSTKEDVNSGYIPVPKNQRFKAKTFDIEKWHE